MRRTAFLRCGVIVAGWRGRDGEGDWSIFKHDSKLSFT